MTRDDSGHPATYLPAEEQRRPAAAPNRNLLLKAEPLSSPVAGVLLAAANAFNESLYGHADQSPLDVGQFDPASGGLFIVACLDGRPVACGGFRRAEPPSRHDAAEVKRMYVVETARRQGLARHLLAALEDAARQRGYREVILDTGAKQNAAHQLYETAGYHRIPGFGIYRDKPGNRAYAKMLG